MRLEIGKCACAIVFALSMQAASAAGDWYVDSLTGDDTNTGAAPNHAWRTITHALLATRSGQAERIHIASGLHDDQLGEQFPLQPWEGQALLGAGPAATFVQTSGPFAIGIHHGVNAPYSEVTSRTKLVGLSISATQQPVLISSSWGAVRPQLQDLDIHGGSLQGVFVYGATALAQPVVLEPLLERVSSHGNAIGLGISTGSVIARDCAFTGNSAAGLQMNVFGSASAVFDRCRFDGNAGAGVELRANAIQFPGPTFGAFTAAFRDSSCSGNGAEGIRASRVDASQTAQLAVSSCTIAANLGAGVRTFDAGADIELGESIVFGNTDDLDLLAAPTIAHCDIGDADFAGVNGNFSADPLFVASLAGDWRLRWGSPCTDRAGLPASASTLDLAGHPRTIDGDLDASNLRDVGAFEFAPLHLAGPAQIGQPLTFELWGPHGAPSTIFFSRRSLSDTPNTTPFGDFWLDPTQYGVFRTANAGASSPTSVVRSIPSSPSLVGRTFSFQALTSSNIAPSGAAYSNAIEITIE